ncbi:hypothetical protein N9850_11015 [Granulosicoccus sp.]|nr:hypothetical protein [Granulosicoccus sp.]MDB4224294.1 hypothetical protein [Granulosicoccus sp.]
MKNIHLIEKSALYNRVPGTENEWTTGTWTMNRDTAESLKDGNVFLHTAQKAPCYLGGKILNCKDAGDGKRWTIRFEFNKDLVNTTTNYCTSNWSVEMLLEPII